MAGEVKAVLTVAKETKNTFRFEERAEDGPVKVGTLYLPKWLVASELQGAKTVEVTIKKVE